VLLRLLIVAVASILGCDPPAAATPRPVSGVLTIAGATLLDGRRVDVTIAGGRITAITAANAKASSGAIDAAGRLLVPAFIDAHVHLAYWPVADRLPQAGIVAAVDLAAPVEAIRSKKVAGLEVAWAGPMITARRGYPTTSWGRDGFGMEVGTAVEAAAAVRSLAAAGARVIKVPIGAGPNLQPSVLAATVRAAHELGLPVAAHAMDDTAVLAAAAAGVDILAHTPAGRLSDAAIEAWSGRAVISTLSAFGAGSAARSNLQRLVAAGAEVLYGTDMGNRRVAGIDGDELRLLAGVGLSTAEIAASATQRPADRFGFDGLGRIEVGARASLMLVSKSALSDAEMLAVPELVIVDGRPLAGR